MNQHITNDSLIDYLHGELAPADDALVYAHVAACDVCTAELEAERSLADALRVSLAADEREFPSLVSAAVWQRIREGRPSTLARMRAFLRPAFAIPIAAALLVGGYFASPLAHPGGASPKIDALYYLEAHAAQASRTPFAAPSGPQNMETAMVDGAGDGAANAAPALLARQYVGFASTERFDAVP